MQRDEYVGPRVSDTRCSKEIDVMRDERSAKPPSRSDTRLRVFQITEKCLSRRYVPDYYVCTVTLFITSRTRSRIFRRYFHIISKILLM